jgi:MYXO-CTERM domain-containing protein
LPYGVGGSTIIDDSWVWAAGTGSNKCFTNQQCDDGNPCTTDTCNTTMGTCSYTNNTAACSVGNPCTMNDTCSGGVCVAGPNQPDGTSCPSGNLCMMTHTCMAGVCQSSNPVTCTALDGCHLVGVCNPANGMCTNPVKVDGSACDDKNLCTQTDSCKAGVCTGSSPVMCPAPDSCHTAGMCDMTTGMCVNPALPDGTACDDNNACTQADTCMNGTCVGIKITCSAMDACHMAGTCDPMVGCSNPQASDGTPCPEGTCNAGVCVKSSGTGGSGAGGSTSASTSSGGVHVPQKSGGCGCRLAEASPFSGGASASALLLALALRRRRRASC